MLIYFNAFVIVRQFKIEQDNKFLFSKIRDINNRSSKPQLNDMFIRDGAKKKQFNQKMRKYELQSIEQENAEIGMRLKMKKSFLDVKRMDEEYKIEHQKILDKIRKIHPGLVLPIIPQKGRGRVIKTEANKKEDEKEYEETKEQEEQKDNEANEAQNEEK